MVASFLVSTNFYSVSCLRVVLRYYRCVIPFLQRSDVFMSPFGDSSVCAAHVRYCNRRKVSRTFRGLRMHCFCVFELLLCILSILSIWSVVPVMYGRNVVFFLLLYSEIQNNVVCYFYLFVREC